MYTSSRSSPLGPIGTPVRTPTNAGQDSTSKSLWARMEQALQADKKKNDLLQELIVRYEYISQEFERLSNERENERHILRNWQREKQEHEANARSMQSALTRNPFVVLLIDGDGMVFRDKLLREGEAGGRRAAAQLQTAITTYIEQETKNIPTESRVICRIYANVKGLAGVLVRNGIIDESGTFEDFVSGFTRGKTLFDFVDVGPGKDRADEKVIESFKLYINDFHCRQIFFGCSHDNGFARTLEEYMTDRAYLSKVTLLEGVPFEKELLSLPYYTKSFPEIFRDTKIVPGMPSGSSRNNVKGYNAIAGLPTRFPPSRTSNTPDGFLRESPILMKAYTDMPRTSSPSTVASDGMPTVIKPSMNWAAKAAPQAPAPLATTTAMSPTYQPTNRDEVIARNRAGQRVDPPCREYDKIEVDRIKKSKMCNVHFLRKECPYGNKCTHLHKYQPTESELAVLRLVARMAPCQNGSACQDIKCIYGHRCPAPPSKSNHVKGTKNCIFGESCKFPEELHDIDCNVVKILVIR